MVSSQRLHGPQPWRRAELSYAAHERAQVQFGGTNSFYPAVGVACDYAATGVDHRSTRKAIGMLIVEVVAWAGIFAGALAYHGLAHLEWLGLDDDAKQYLWVQSCDDGLCDVQHYLHQLFSGSLLEIHYPAES